MQSAEIFKRHGARRASGEREDADRRQLDDEPGNPSQGVGETIENCE